MTNNDREYYCFTCEERYTDWDTQGHSFTMEHSTQKRMQVVAKISFNIYYSQETTTVVQTVDKTTSTSTSRTFYSASIGLKFNLDPQGNIDIYDKNKKVFQAQVYDNIVSVLNLSLRVKRVFEFNTTR